MDKPNNTNPIDRPLKEIVGSMSLLIMEKKVKGQFARDLEKLCITARASKYWDEEVQS